MRAQRLHSPARNQYPPAAARAGAGGERAGMCEGWEEASSASRRAPSLSSRSEIGKKWIDFLLFSG